MRAYDAPVLENRPFRVRPWLLGVALFVVAFAAFALSMSGPFLFDDRLLIEGNYKVHSFAHWYQWLTSTIWDTNYDPSKNASNMLFWRPLLLASFALDWQIGAGSPIVFHCTNLIIHAVNAILAWMFLRQWFKVRGLAFALAALFALHPVQSEVVCWISGRGDSLCLLGLLVSLHGLRWVQTCKLFGTIAFVVGAVVAFASKEMAVVLPVLVAMDRFAAQDGSSLVQLVREQWKPLAASMFLVAIYLVWRSIVFEDALGSHGFEAGQIAPFALEAFGRATALLLWPLDTTLGRAVTQASGGVLLPRYDYAFFGAAVLIAVSALAGRLWRTDPRFGVGWLCFLGCWFPVSGIISHGELSLISPRYLYVPLVPALFMLGAGIESLGRRQWVSPRGLVPVVLAFGFLSVFRAGDFSSAESFWRAEIVANPNYVSAQDYYIVRELRESRPHSALNLSLAFLASNRTARFESLNAELGFHVLEALSAATADFDRDTLLKVAQYGDALAQGRHAILEVPDKGVHLGWPQGSKLDWEWRAKRKRLLILTADLWSRLGEDDKALRRVAHAREGCEQCWTLFGHSGTIFARAGKLGEALALADLFDKYASPSEKGQLHDTLKDALSLAPYLQGGSAPPVLIANYYSSLQAFGRAYAVAHDAFKNPPDDPEAHKVLAELALRAGDIEAAGRMLSRSMLPSEIETWEREKRKNVLWQDAEIPPETWMPNLGLEGLN